jgi:LacI family transcriptional regulator
MPTAILASNDLTALGIVWEAIDSGMKVPVDLSVIGFDNLAIASDITPSLTTISLPRFQIGTLAMKTLLGLINSPNESFLTYLKNNLVVDTNLVIRNSTAQSN